MRRPIRLTAAALGLLLWTTACGGSPDSGPEPLASPPSGPIKTVSSYVALGDSYSAGSGIKPADIDSYACFRSKANWPTLLARKLKAKSFTDVSCAGAPTSHLTGDFTPARGIPVPPQLDSVTDQTQLITLTLGGNDSGTFPAILTSCADALNQDADVCDELVDNRLEGMLGEVERGLQRGLQDVRRRAPGAKVVLVGYLRVSSGGTGCKELGTTGKRAALQARAEKSLDQTLATAAGRAGVEFLSLSTLSKGHDACAGDEAWVNGAIPNGDENGVALHPNSAGTKAMTKAVAQLLRKG